MKNTSPFEKEVNIHNHIFDILKKNPRGLTTTEIGRLTKISRKTLEKHLQILVYENEIYLKQFGSTRVYYPNNRLHYVDFEKLKLNNKTYWFDIMENEYGKYLLIQEKRKNGEWSTKGSVLIPLDKINMFIKSLNKILKSRKLNKIKE